MISGNVLRLDVTKSNRYSCTLTLELLALGKMEIGVTIVVWVLMHSRLKNLLFEVTSRRKA